MKSKVSSPEQGRPHVMSGIGNDIVRALAEMLADGVLFANDEGICRTNDLASFQLLPSCWQTENRLIVDVEISCSARGHRLVDWERVPIRIETAASSGDFLMEFLDKNGRVRFHDLELGQYRVFLGLGATNVDCAIPTGRDHVCNYSIEALGIDLRVAKEERGLAFSAATTNPALKGCSIMCCYRDRKTRRLATGRLIELAADPHSPSQLQGEAIEDEQVAVSRAGETDLVFIVVPPTPTTEVKTAAANEEPPSRGLLRFPFPLVLAACGVGLLCLTAWLLWSHAKSNVVIRLADASGIITVSKGGEVGLPRHNAVPSWLSDRVRELLESGRASPTPEFAQIVTNNSREPNLLGESEERNRPMLLEPLSPTMRSRFPTFRWSRVADASDYRLIMETPSTKLTNNAGSMTNCVWSERAPSLLPGKTYTWHVETAMHDDPRVSVPARFYLLATNQQSELRRMEDQCGNSAIMLTALYESWGLFDEALPMLHEIQRHNLGNMAASRIAKELKGRASVDPPFDLIYRLLATDTTPGKRLALLDPSNNPAFTNAIGELNQRARKASLAGDFDAALHANSIATELATPLADKASLGFCLIARGEIAIDQAQYTNAIRACKDAVELFQRLPKQPGLGRAWCALGKALTKAGQYKQARDEYVLCRQLGTDLHDRDLQARSCSGMGEADRSQGNFTNALHEFNESLALDRLGMNHGDVVDDLFNLSNVRLEMGDKETALSNLTECLNYYMQTNDLDGEAVTLNSISMIQEMRGDFPGALSNLQQCLKIRRDTTNQEGVIVALNSIGVVYLDAGQASAAMPWFRESAATAQTNNESPYRAMALANIGTAYQKLGDFTLAWSNMEASYEIETNLGEHLGVAQSRAQMAELLELTGFHRDARAAFSTAAQEFHNIPSPQDEAVTLFNLAAVDDAMKDFDGARSNLNASLAIREPLQDKQGVAGVRTAFGELELEAGHLEEAIAQFHSALEIATNIGANASEPICGIGEAELRRRHPIEAVGWFEKARDLATVAGDVEQQSQALTGLGEALRAADRMPEAVAAFEGAERVIDEIRSTIQDPAQSIGFFGIHDRPYQSLAFCLADLGRKEEAWKAVERGRARTLIEMMRRGGAPMAKAMTPVEIADSQHIDEELKFAILRDQAVASDKMLSREERSEARERLNAARQKFDQFRRELYQQHPGAATQHGESAPPDLAALGPILDKSALAVLEYLLGEDSMKIIVVRAQTNGTPILDIVDVAAPRTKIQQLARSLSEHLAQSMGMTSWGQEDAEKLHSLLIAPISNLISNVPTLCVIPDEELWEIPFAALQNHGGQAVVDDHAVFYAPSVSALIAMRNLSVQHVEQARTAPRGTRIMVMANPKLIATAQTSNPMLGDNLDEIPGTARQARELANLFGNDAKIYVGTNATEYRVKQESEHFRMLHFATHGVFVPSSPLHSGIFLTPGEGEDGFLEAHEIMELNWNAELVVLAACETARGQVQAGEGIWGLSWAMFVAGSPANLLTLWRVRDDSTADFMISFYKNLDKSGDSMGAWRKAEALRRAQLSLKADARFAHPFYWAPFVLLGDGK